MSSESLSRGAHARVGVLTRDKKRAQFTVVVKIKFRFSIRTTAVERVNRCRIEPVLPQNGDRKTTVALPCYGHGTAQCPLK